MNDLWSAYDQPALARQYVYERADGQREIHLYIEGIHCAACGWQIRTTLQRAFPGLTVAVNVATARAEICYPPTVALSALLRTIAGAGFTPNLFRPAENERRQQAQQRAQLLRLAVAGLGMMQVMMLALALYAGAWQGMEAQYRALFRWLSLLLTTPVFFYSGWPFLQRAGAGLRARTVNMDVPIALALAGAYGASVYHTVLGRGEIYFESVAMFIFFLSLSRHLEFRTRRRAQLNAIQFMKLLPEVVERWEGSASVSPGAEEAPAGWRQVPLSTVQPGDRLRVRAEATIPVDGLIVAGSSRVDEAMLSGESATASSTAAPQPLPRRPSNEEAPAGWRQVPLSTVQPGDRLRVRAEATIPVDGLIVAGSSRVDEAMLSGESEALPRRPGDRVLAGSHNLASPLEIEVSATGQETTLAGIQRLMARAEQHKSARLEENFRLAQQSIIALLLLAALGYGLWSWLAPERAFEIVLAVLVATCPCALALATPTVLTGALNHAHRQRILIKDSATLDRLLRVRDVVFDKTGTLTEGRFRLLQSHYDSDAAELNALAASLERHSSHPLAWTVRQLSPDADLPLAEVAVVASQGVSGLYRGRRWYIGRREFMPISCLPPPTEDGVWVYLSDGERLRAQWQLDDPPRPGLTALLAELGADYRLHLYSGDRPANVQRLAQLGPFTSVAAGLLPADKLRRLETLPPGGRLMVGDGINDGPVLAAAEVAVAVGRANPLSQSQADIVLLAAGVEALPYLFRLARRCRRLIRQNLAWALGYNLLIVPLALAGLLSPWLAALGMSLSSLLVVGNGLRIGRTPPP